MENVSSSILRKYIKKKFNKLDIIRKTYYNFLDIFRNFDNISISELIIIIKKMNIYGDIEMIEKELEIKLIEYIYVPGEVIYFEKLN